MDDKRFMSLAIEEARRGAEQGHGGPFGAVVTRGAEVLASAHNSVLSDNDPTRHAEIKAISLAARKTGSFDLSGCAVYSTTEPCPMCFAAIHWARIGLLVYGTSIEDVKKLGFNEMTITAEKMKAMAGSGLDIRGSFMREECGQLLRFWESLPEKGVY